MLGVGLAVGRTAGLGGIYRSLGQHHLRAEPASLSAGVSVHNEAGAEENGDELGSRQRSRPRCDPVPAQDCELPSADR